MAMSTYNSTKVTMVGHSLGELMSSPASLANPTLGAAIALLDAVYLPLQLPTETKFKTVTYGFPRVNLILQNRPRILMHIQVGNQGIFSLL